MHTSQSKSPTGSAASTTSSTTSARNELALDVANTLKAFIGLNFMIVAYAFSKAGMLRGVLGLIFITFVTEHCCLLLVDIKESMYHPLSSPDPHDTSATPHPDDLHDAENPRLRAPNPATTTQSTSLPADSPQQHSAPPSNRRPSLPAIANDQCRPPSFGDIAFYAGGRVAERLINFSLVLTQFGYCVAYLIFLSQTMHDVLSSSAPVPLFVLLPLPILIALSTLSSIRSLGPFSMFANGALLLGFAAVVTFIANHFNWTPTRVPLSSFPLFFGQMTAALEGIGLIIPVQTSMHNKEKFPLVLRIALVCLTSILMVVGVLGFATFGADTRSIILLNFGQSPVVVAVKAVLIVGILFTYPLQILPVFEFAERILLSSSPNPASQSEPAQSAPSQLQTAVQANEGPVSRPRARNRGRGGTTTATIKTAVAPSFQIDDDNGDEEEEGVFAVSQRVDDFEAIGTGGASGTCQVGGVGGSSEAGSGNDILSGVSGGGGGDGGAGGVGGCGGVGGGKGEIDLDTEERSGGAANVGERGSNEGVMRVRNLDVGGTSVFLRDRRRIAVRFVVVASTAVVAMVAGASFGLFQALVGSMGASVLAYTAPALFHFLAFRDRLSPLVKAKDIAIVVFGVIGGVIGTVTSLWEIFQVHRGNASPT